MRTTFNKLRNSANHSKTTQENARKRKQKRNVKDQRNQCTPNNHAAPSLQICDHTLGLEPGPDGLGTVTAARARRAHIVQAARDSWRAYR